MSFRKHTGEALTKRYEVKDLETGEVLSEPLYVLRPQHDHVAFTAMSAYARLCGVDKSWEDPHTVSRPPKDVSEWRAFLDSLEIDTTGAEDSDLLLDPVSLASQGVYGDGSARYMVKLCECYLKREVVGLLIRGCSDETQQAAKEWMDCKAAVS